MNLASAIESGAGGGFSATAFFKIFSCGLVLTGLFNAKCAGETTPAKNFENAELLRRFEDFREPLGIPPNSIVAPGVEFYALVMLEHLSSGVTKEALEKLVNTDAWKGGGHGSFGWVEGWRKLRSFWKMDSFVRPSPYGQEVAKLYRTTILNSDEAARDLREAVENEMGELGSSQWDTRSALFTVAEVAPKWEGGLRKAANERDGQGDVLQTHVITTGYFDDGGGENWAISIPLHKGGSFLISPSAIREDISWEERDVIIFIPESTHSCSYEWNDRAGANTIVGAYSDYSLMGGGETLRLDAWIIRATLVIKAHTSPAQQINHSSILGRKLKPPMVVRVEYPFFFQLKGPHGEILMEGRAGAKIGARW
jgi:hypothetical protein